MKLIPIPDAPLLTIQNQREKKYAQTRILISRLHALQDRHIDSKNIRLKITKALDLMLKVHFAQKDRPDGQPYINHPLEVTLLLMEKFGLYNPDILIAALLHDTLENQPEKIIKVLMPQKPIAGGKIIKMASMAIGQKFGSGARNLVERLTGPDFKLLIGNSRGDGVSGRELKNRLYKEHFFEIFDTDSQASCIKLADFYCNALALGNLPEGEKKKQLREKYAGVLPGLIERMERLDPDNPLFGVKKEILGDLKTARHTDYYV